MFGKKKKTNSLDTRFHQFFPEIFKLYSFQGLCKNVCQLFICGTVVHFEPPLFMLFCYKVIPNIYLLTSTTKLSRLNKLNSTLVINVHNSFDLYAGQFFNKVLQVLEFFAAVSRRDILSFCRR